MSVSVVRADGSSVGQYSGQAEFSETYSVYQLFAEDRTQREAEALNKAFNHAMTQIRDQILRGFDKMSPPRAHSPT